MKTLFQEWAGKHNKTVPDVAATQDNPYLQALKLAEIRESTFIQRQKRQMHSWYEHHPACKQVLLPLDWRGVQLRGETIINIDERFGTGWFKQVTGVRVSVDSQTLEVVDEERPEHRLEESEDYGSALEMATAMNSKSYQAEVKTFDSFDRQARKRKKRKVSDKQLELEFI